MYSRITIIDLKSDSFYVVLSPCVGSVSATFYLALLTLENNSGISLDFHSCAYILNDKLYRVNRLGNPYVCKRK